MSKTLRDEFEKETGKSAFQDVGGFHYCARDEYAEWLESALTTSRDENKRLREAIKAYSEARRRWMSQGDSEVQQEVDAWKKLDNLVTDHKEEETNEKPV